MRYSCKYRSVFKCAVGAFLLLAMSNSAYTQQSNSISIDVHAHIFNGEDVPLDGFIEEIALHSSDSGKLTRALKVIVKPLTAHMKLWADGHRQENKKLNKLLRNNGHAIPLPINILAETIQKETVITDEIKKDGKMTALEMLVKIRAALKEKTKDDDKEFRGNITLDVIKFPSWLRRFTAPRLSNMKYLLKNHGDKGDVDLFVTALVDMDYWLKGETKSHLADQILINSKLSIVSQGRILPFVAFDPYRDVVEGGRALKLVQTAILDYGFVGVKLYPPMGFKALGNSEEYYREIKDPIWKNPHRNVPVLSDKTLAKGVENSLNELYKWAEQNNVPIMAHANRSNYSRRGFIDSADPDNWKGVLEKYPNLRINLAHFGGIDSFTGTKKKWAQSSIALMIAHPNLYADLGNFKLRKSDGIDFYLAELKNQVEKHPELKNRLMNGSDWFMHAARSYSKNYPAKLILALRRNDIPKDFVKRFMGLNAVSFLGIKSGPVRDRLDAFYEKYNVTGAWREKL